MSTDVLQIISAESAHEDVAFVVLNCLHVQDTLHRAV